MKGRFAIKTSLKQNPALIALIVHFPIFALLHTVPFIINRGLFSFSDSIHFPIERWIVWVIPSVVLIKVFEKYMYIDLKSMFFNKVKSKMFLWFLLLLPILVCFTLIFSSPTRQFSSINEFLSVASKESYNALVVPAIPEEMVFRAWILNAIIGKTKNKTILALVVSNILFVLIHLPTYFYGNYPIQQMISGGITVFVLGCVFGVMFLKSKNIFIPILAHCIWDTISFTLYV